MRILIAGYPKTGKTTLATRLAAEHGISTILHTDDLINQMSWEAQSDQVAEWIKRPGLWIIEGTTVTRGLRKFLKDSLELPCTELHYLVNTWIPLTPGQNRLCTSIANAWHDCNRDPRIQELLSCPLREPETDSPFPVRSSKSTKPHTQSELPEPSTP